MGACSSKEASASSSDLGSSPTGAPPMEKNKSQDKSKSAVQPSPSPTDSTHTTDAASSSPLPALNGAPPLIKTESYSINGELIDESKDATFSVKLVNIETGETIDISKFNHKEQSLINQINELSSQIAV